MVVTRAYIQVQYAWRFLLGGTRLSVKVADGGIDMVITTNRLILLSPEPEARWCPVYSADSELYEHGSSLALSTVSQYYKLAPAPRAQCPSVSVIRLRLQGHDVSQSLGCTSATHSCTRQLLAWYLSHQLLSLSHQEMYHSGPCQ